MSSELDRAWNKYESTFTEFIRAHPQYASFNPPTKQEFIREYNEYLYNQSDIWGLTGDNAPWSFDHLIEGALDNWRRRHELK